MGGRAGTSIGRCCRILAAAALLPVLAPEPLFCQKNDTVVVSNGNLIVGEIKQLQRGQLKYDTDALGTVYVEWPKVTSVATNKTFEITLESGGIHFGSLGLGERDSVAILAAGRTLSVATQSVVALQRIKPSFWDALDGNLNLGFDFTQQSSKLDLSLSGKVKYARRVQESVTAEIFQSDGLVITELAFNSSFSRQDDTDNIERLQASLTRARQFESRWFWLVALGGERNSQLSLDYRLTVAAGAGRVFVQSNRFDLSAWVGPSYSLERFTGGEPGSTIPLLISTQAYYFTWGSLDTTLSGQLQVAPVLNEWGRWRVNLTLNAARELVSKLDLNVGLTESYDSDPSSEDAAKNDFSINTSIGWSF